MAWILLALLTLIVGCLRAQLPDVLQRIRIGLAVAQPYGERGRSNRAAVGQPQKRAPIKERNSATLEDFRDLLASELGWFEVRCHGVDPFANCVDSRQNLVRNLSQLRREASEKNARKQGVFVPFVGPRILHDWRPERGAIVALAEPRNRLWKLLGKSDAKVWRFSVACARAWPRTVLAGWSG